MTESFPALILLSDEKRNSTEAVVAVLVKTQVVPKLTVMPVPFQSRLTSVVTQTVIARGLSLKLYLLYTLVQ
jgi:hypothetical protein